MITEELPDLKLIKSHILQIGESLTLCSHRCSGIRNEPEKGIVPRGLIYEERSGNKKGVVVCGLNPGVAEQKENDYRLQQNLNYSAVIDCWEKLNIKNEQYFKKTRHLIDELELFGDILWTNIAKCECLNSKVRISFSSQPQTFRFCAEKYLKNELSKIPLSWPIIACGKDAFTALSYIFTERRLIGIPHPTGAGIEFGKLYEGGKTKDGKLKQSVKTNFKVFFESEPNGALWLRGNSNIPQITL